MCLPVAYRFGPQVKDPNRTIFRLWAPATREVLLQIEGLAETPMMPREDGWYEAEAPSGAGAHYRFHIGNTTIPDPASRMQADDVHGASVVADSGSYEWQCESWRGLPWEDAVVYELHPGLLGGFEGIQQH